jgi:hypothetical protein
MLIADCLSVMLRIVVAQIEFTVYESSVVLVFHRGWTKQARATVHRAETLHTRGATKLTPRSRWK